MTIFTIGYEGATVNEVIAALTHASVEQVIDVRQLPLSRRPGFSKSSLSAALAEHGIGYVHLKALGTPKAGRDAARKGDRATLEAVYAGQLELPEAQAQAARMRALAAEKRSALLCFERDAKMCHRTLLLAAEGEGVEVVDLVPTSTPVQNKRAWRVGFNQPATGSLIAPSASRSSGP